ncbi:DUF1566 domain-containing protein [Chloroflexota bacterium]
MNIKSVKQLSVILLAASLILPLACASSVPATDPIVTPEPSPESSSKIPPVSSSGPTLETPTVDQPPSILQGEPWLGYTLISPAGINQAAFLIDMSGQIVNEWSINGNPAKMLQDGSLLGSMRTRKGQAASINQQSALGGKDFPDVIEFVQVSWVGQKEWSFSDWDMDDTGIMMSRQHHDFQREGNPTGYFSPGQDFIVQGKTLILARENKFIPKMSIKELESDVIYEVDWEGNFTGFEWHAIDHFDEMGFDESARKAIYDGLTYDEDKDSADWLHINSMSLLGQNHWYDETQDERFNPANIIISSRNANFIAIVSRTTEEIVWRTGPDFSAGTSEHGLGQFVGQHHAHMIPNGLPGQGNILVFDNGGRSGYGGQTGYPRNIRHYSRVLEFNPVTLEIVWQYGSESGEDQFFSRNISSAQRLPNGNTLITDGTNGRIIEVTPGKEKVWEFNAPASDSGNNAIYRAYRIPPEWVPDNPSGYVEWSTLLSIDTGSQVPLPESTPETASAFVIVDTGQNRCYDNSEIISCPQPSGAFFGQDAQYQGKQPIYQDNGDGTVTDLNTGLMWQKDTGVKMTWEEAALGADSFRLGGYTDWRMSSIKELYSLIIFTGVTGRSESDSTPYIDTNYFLFNYGDTDIGERFIDSQYISSTRYVSTTIDGNDTAFGVNYGDGRIKGYPITNPRTREDNKFYVRYVRGNDHYGKNNFTDNRDGTITDVATGLQWMQMDSGDFNVGDDGNGKLNWEQALEWAENLEYAGYSDWRLPDAKELQGIVDYNRSPDTTNSAAIDSIFTTTSINDEGGNTNYPFYWTSTTHLDGRNPGSAATYIAFGDALGFMEIPPNSGVFQLLDIHGAGAQRSDPKIGNPEDYPYGFGPQGDVRRIYNYVRCVRNANQ